MISTSLQDLVHMRTVFRYLVANQYPTTLLLFPEGTDLSRSNVEKAHKYADSRRLQRHDYVLLPKVAGFLGKPVGAETCGVKEGRSFECVFEVILASALQSPFAVFGG